MCISNKDVIVIIVNYNSSEVITKCLNSVFEQTNNLNFSVVLVDNASTDNSSAIIKKSFPQVNLIQNNENLGFGKANNQVFNLYKAKYYFLLNPDTELINNAIKILFDFMEEKISVACVGAGLYNTDMTLQHSYGNFPTVKKIFFEFGLSKVFKNYFNNNLSEKVIYNQKEAGEVPYVTGASLMIRSEVLNKTGVFDPDFFLYYEETELQYRIRKNGYKICVQPEAKIYHQENYSINKMNSYQRVKTIESSRSLYYKKVYGLKTALLIKSLFLIKYTLLFLLRRKNITFSHIKVMLKLITES